MKYIVQKVPSRDTSHLEAAIPYLITVIEREGDPVKGFDQVLLKARDCSFVRLEDDIDLCDGFVEKIESAINLHPDKIISFFTLRKKIDRPTMFKGRNFCMFQCTYFPQGMARKIHGYYLQDIWPKKENNPKDPDSFLSDFLRETGTDYMIWHPSLVQHHECKSIIDPKRSSKRQSVSYE